MKEWSNWSGSLRFVPATIKKPETEDELRDIVSESFRRGTRCKLVGAGHSSSPLVKTHQVLIDLSNFKGIVSQHKKDSTVTFRAGVSVHEANMALEKKQLALFNTGDVDVQTLAGAISTGTHGSGKSLQNLASMLMGVRVVNYKGEVEEYQQASEADIIRAMRVSLGALGIFSEIKVKVEPLVTMHRMEFFTSTDVCVSEFNGLAEENRNLDFYWYPRSDEVKIRILNEEGKGSRHFTFEHYCKEEERGYVGDILPRERVLKFDEMEYAVPFENGIPCFLEVRKRIKEKHRKEVAWRVLYRTIKSDENYISPHYGRDSVSISLHHNAGLPFREFFSDIEPIFIHYGGRPHWAKIYNAKAQPLNSLYPEWNKFQEIRERLDPEEFFLNEHLAELFGHGENKIKSIR